MTYHPTGAFAADPVIVAERQRATAGKNGSDDLKLAIDRAITRQASAWGIGIEQARTLLLDRRMP